MYIIFSYVQSNITRTKRSRRFKKIVSKYYKERWNMSSKKSREIISNSEKK
jgi:hypothetical protein